MTRKSILIELEQGGLDPTKSYDKDFYEALRIKNKNEKNILSSVQEIEVVEPQLKISLDEPGLNLLNLEDQPAPLLPPDDKIDLNASGEVVLNKQEENKIIKKREKKKKNMI